MIEGARQVEHKCGSCDKHMVINVLGDKEVGKLKYECQHCRHLNDFYGEQKEDGNVRLFL